MSPMERKFKYGDIVVLDGDIVHEEDTNHNISGRVVGYSFNPFESCPTVEVFTPFNLGEKRFSTVDFLGDEWWILSRDECRCDSLL